MIDRRKMLATLGLGFALGLAPRAALADQHSHLAQAIAELKEGIHEGKQHLYSSFAEHLHNAYDHARAERGADPRGHIKVATDHIRMALRAAKRTHHANRLQRGIEHAERALIHLKAAHHHHQ